MRTTSAYEKLTACDAGYLQLILVILEFNEVVRCFFLLGKHA
ncbi:hypothetical protein [Neisseria yangbaofengii]|nr:hypothetical protein [Neisseria yangbaofengii]